VYGLAVMWLVKLQFLRLKEKFLAVINIDAIMVRRFSAIIRSKDVFL